MSVLNTTRHRFEADGFVTAAIGSGSDSPNRVQSRSDSASITQQKSHRTAAGRSYTNGPLMSPLDDPEVREKTRRSEKLKPLPSVLSTG